MSDQDFDDSLEDDCSMCGGDGVVMLSDCGPSEWGEDCFCEVDRAVACPECRMMEKLKASQHRATAQPKQTT